MNFEKFEMEFADLVNLFKQNGFHKNPSKFESVVFSKFLDYHSEVKIITSRLEEEIAESDSFQRYFSDYAMGKTKLYKTKLEKHGQTLLKMMLDLSDFYVYTRRFLDTLTVCIGLSLRCAGNKKWEMTPHTVHSLLKEKKMQAYKREIDFRFFEGLEKKLTWIRDFKDSRDGLLHQYYHFVFTTTKQGDSGYDIMDGKKVSWGTETVRGILGELQNTIDNLSDLMEYLVKNLPRP
jgi:hypothetical protein